MAIISLDKAEVRRIQLGDPNRRYESVEGRFNNYLILMDEAQEVRLGEREVLSIAYAPLSESNFGMQNYVEVKNTKRLKTLTDVI